MVASIASVQQQRVPLPFASYETRYRRGGVMRLVNCYAEQGQEKGQIYLQGAPGLKLQATLPKTPQRNAFVFQEKLYVVAGDTLYLVEETGAFQAIGMIPGDGYTPMAQNGAQLVIVNTPDAYIYDGTTFEQITDPDFVARGALDVVFAGNYFLFVEPDSGRFFGSELGDGKSYDPLDFATAENSPDNLVGIAADHGDVFLAGKTTCEIWGNVGGSGFPWSKRFNGVVEQGCGAGASIVTADQTLFWIDETRIARRLDGVTPIRVSQHGVEAAWQGYSTIADAEGYSYTQDGHIFIVWQFPTEKKTWVYDATTRQWHERESYPDVQHRSRWFINVYGKVMTGDRLTGNLGDVDPESFDEYGDPLVMTWTYPAIYAEDRRAIHHQLDIVAETGVGAAGAVDPQLMLQVSDDGGKVFDAVPPQALGKVGEYKTNVTWYGLGSSPDRVYRGSISDPVRRAVYQTHLRATGGNF